MTFADLQSKLTKYGQEQLLDFWDKLSDDEKLSFEKELQKIDLAYINTVFASAMKQLEQDQEKKDELMEALPDDVFARLSDTDEMEIESWYNEGLKQVSEGKVAVLLLAGGQGTRLGVNYPKGMYNVGLPSNKTLYQLQAERIWKLQELAAEKFSAKGIITWYIMTSQATKEFTQQYFKENNFFGLEEENIIFFEQHTLPCMSFEGKIILDNFGKVAKAPDGNGGLYKALKTENIVQDMERRQITSIHVYCVDNILVKMADPVFIGFCSKKEAECGAKVVEKVNPNEAVGVVCKCDGKYQVVEYSEISSTTAEKKNHDGHLVFNAGNICNHFFTLDFLKSVVKDHDGELPHHVARKKIPYVSSAGERIKPDKPNGIKMEKFVFDVFQYANEFAVLEVEREDEFSPLKNGPGAGSNCPETARQDLINCHFRAIVKAGGKVLNDVGSEVDAHEKTHPFVCEISPLVSYAGEGLEHYVKGKTYSFDEVLRLEPSEANGVVLQVEPVNKKTKKD